MNNFKLRKIMAVVICLLFLCNVFTVNIAALDAVSYVDENGVSHSVTDYTVFTGGSYVTLNDGVYVVNSNISVFGAIYVSGNADLILCDGYTLESRDRLVVNPGATLNIYGQSAGTGTLKAISAYQVYQSNRSDSIKVNGQLIINSGTVNALGEYEHTGITGSGVITINGGTVTASGGTNGAGIGGSYNDNNASVTGSLIINGGTVTATGGQYGAGIGGAGKTGTATGGSWGTIEINGGTVTASSGQYAAAIGCGYPTACGNITINGGTVTATPHVDANGTKGEAFGKYGVYITGGGLEYRGSIGTVEINGGNITANGSIGGSSTVLNWTNLTDSVYAAEYTSSDISILNDFQVGTQPVFATPDNIAGQTIHAYNGPYNYVNLFDDDGVTPIASPIKVIPGGIPVTPENPSKPGYTFVRWELNGSAYTFGSAITSDIDVLAKWNQHYSVPYVDENGVTQSLAGNAYTELCSTYLPTTLTSGWYVVGSGATYNTRITIDGDVKIILQYNKILNANNGGIRVEQGNSLTFYGQPAGDGSVSCTSPASGNAPIGSNANTSGSGLTSAGNITINGGDIYVRAYNYAAGIGGGNQSSGGTITINGGTVDAKGVQAAAIGDGYYATGSTVTINGGTVIAAGGAYSAAIGGTRLQSGYSGGTSTVNYNGGVVSATAYASSAATYNGIGAYDSSKAVVNLNWTSSSGSLFATNYNADTVNFQKDFVLQGTSTVATRDNIDGNRIVPCTSNVYTVDFIDESDSTPIYSQIRIVDGQTVAEPDHPTKVGYRFVEWRLNGVAFDFSSPITANTVLRAHWVEGGDVSYIDENGVSRVKAQGTYNYIETTAQALTLSGSVGWYVVSGDISLAQRLIISGDVHIILADGCTFNVPKGITCSGTSALHIYGQANGTGELNCLNPDANYSGIGSATYNSPGSIIINGGVINAKGAIRGAAIGGSDSHGGGNITINGGEVNATAGTYSAAIGSANGSQNSGDATVIVINGGEVNASSSSGCAIGSGTGARFDSITINGGIVSAETTGYHAAIGGLAKDASTQPIVINGGYVSVSGGRNSAAIGASADKGIKAVTINGGTVFAIAGTNGTGIGDSTTDTNKDCDITLNWTSTEDTYFSDGYTGVVTFARAFLLDGTTTQATASNINGATIIPDADLTVRFLDTDGVTELFLPQTVKNGMSATQPASDPEKPGYAFNGWLVDGDAFDFSYSLRKDTDIIADFEAIPVVSYLDANGNSQNCSAYYTVGSGTTAFTNNWYVVNGEVITDSRITVSGTVNLILCDDATLTARKGIEVPVGATLNIYAQSGRSGALNVTIPDNNNAGIGGSNGASSGTITFNGGNIEVYAGANASAIGGGSSGTITFNSGCIIARGFVGADSNAADGSGYNVTLGWNDSDDDYYAVWYKANVTLEKDFFYVGTTDLVTVDNLYQKEIVPAANFVEYYDGYGNRMACTNYTVMTDATSVYLNDGGWYVVNADTTITRAINVNGTSHIILCDGVTLRAQNIAVGASGAVYIYGQKENTGAFRSVPPASGTGYFAGIGGSGNSDTGEIHILGGKITAHGYNGAAGIGGSTLHSASVIEIARATVNADGGNTTISGVTAGGAGIGGGVQGKSGTITIHSGKVTVLGGSGAAGIGSGYNATGTTAKQFDVTVYGGDVDAQGGGYLYSSRTYYGAGIGTGVADPSSTVKYTIAYGDINIQGGKVLANLIGAGDGFTPDRPTYNVNITLSWTNAGDYIEADDYSYNTLTFAKDFILDGTLTPATQTNIAGNRIVPVISLYDINEDGFFDINDVAFVMATSVGEVAMTAAQEAKADINGDTVVDGFDAAIIDRKLYQNV